MAFCTSCGTKLVDGIKFCTNCGAKVNIPVIKQEENLVPQSEPAPQPVKQPMPQPVAQQPVKQPMPQPAAQQPVKQPMPQPAAQQPVKQPMPQPVAQQPVKQPMPQPVAQQPVRQPMPQPVAQQPVRQPIPQQVRQPQPSNRNKKSPESPTGNSMMVAMIAVLAIIAVLLVIIVFVVLKGMNDNKKGPNMPGTIPVASNANSDVPTTTPIEEITTPEETKRQLSVDEENMVNAIKMVMNNNLTAVNEMFFFGNHLSTSNEILDGWQGAAYGVYVVNDARFSTYDKYTSFLYATYVENVANDKFINMVRYLPGATTGRLGCIVDQDRAGGAVDYYHPHESYNVDWSSYDIEIENFVVGRDEYSFRAIANDGYVTYGTVRKSGYAWLLTDAVY